jgi:hypothetical protein
MIEENQNTPEQEPAVEGDTHQPETEMHATEIAFPTPKRLTIRPNGVNVLLFLDEAPTTQGGIHLPQKMKSLDFITATVLAKGPDCKFVKDGDRIIVALKALINQEGGILVGGAKLFFTQENLVIAVIEEAAPAPAQ